MTDLQEDLNRQAAEALGWRFDCGVVTDGNKILYSHFSPLHDDAQCGKLQDEFKVSVEYVQGATPDNRWQAYISGFPTLRYCSGDRREAILKAIIALSGKGEE